MVSRVERLRPVLQLAADAETDAADVYHQARGQWQQALAKQDELHDYCADYRRGLQHTGAPQSAQSIARARGFLQQLTQAQQQQAQIARQLQKVSEQKRDAWHAAHLKHRALAELLSRLTEEEQRALTRQEEKMLDEWVNAGAARRAQDASRMR